MKSMAFNHSLIRDLREKLSLTREELLVRLHNIGLTISFDTLGSWERGDTTPDADRLPKLAQVLGIPVGDFFNGR